MSECEHHCGNSTYRVLGPTYNTRSWNRWLQEHGIPVAQMPYYGSWVIRDEASNTVTVLVLDWGSNTLATHPSTALAEDLPVDEIYDRGVSTYLVPDGDVNELGSPVSGHWKMRVFTSHLNRAPAPFPTSSDCGQGEIEVAYQRVSAQEYEHRPLRPLVAV